MLTLRVLYSCHTCNLSKVACEVAARGEEPLSEWMPKLLAALSADHQQRSPGCVPLDGQLKDVMIPISGADRVGGPPVN